MVFFSFWLIYAGGIIISAGIEPVIKHRDFSALYAAENATVIYFHIAMIILVISVIISASQRLLDFNLGTYFLLATLMLMSIPIVAPIVIVVLGTMPGFNKVNKYGEAPGTNSYFKIISAFFAPLIIYYTWVLAKLIKSSPIPM